MNKLVCPSFETAIKSLNKGLVACWYCENLVLVENTRKVSVNLVEQDMCENCFNSFENERSI